MDSSLVDADAVAVVLAHLRAHQRVLEVLGGADRISGLREAPWPHLVIAAGTGGDVGDLRTTPIVGEVALELWDHPDGAFGKAALRRGLIVVLEAIAELAQGDYVPGAPVVYGVQVTVPPGPQPVASGQNRWATTVALTLNPPA